MILEPRVNFFAFDLKVSGSSVVSVAKFSETGEASVVRLGRLKHETLSVGGKFLSIGVPTECPGRSPFQPLTSPSATPTEQ